MMWIAFLGKSTNTNTNSTNTNTNKSIWEVQFW